jgi:hypothetical protein
MYIQKVEINGFLTGKNSKNDTLRRFRVGGTDLGMPLYDSVNDKLYFAFGDTFSDPFGPDKPDINFKKRWRSNTLATVKISDSYEDGIEIIDFYKNPKTNIAKAIIEGHHMGDNDFIEVTKIPTGLIEVNGIYYMFHFSIRTWRPIAIMNYGGCVKSTDFGKTWTKVHDLSWVDEREPKYDEQTSKLINEPLRTKPGKGKFIERKAKVDVNEHKGHYYTLNFPVDGKDGYVYLFGQCGFRTRGIRLARVLKENIEKFNEYEYMVDTDINNLPIWVKGQEGIKMQFENPNSYLIPNPSGEMSVVYNNYLGKWILFRMNDDVTQAVMHVSDNVYGPYSKAEVIVNSSDKRIPNKKCYAPLTHEKLFEQDGKIMNILLSQWLPHYNPIILRVELE